MKKTKIFLLLITMLSAIAFTACGGGSGGGDGNPDGGSGVNTPDITVTDSAAPNDDLQVPFGIVSVGFTLDQTVTVTNDGAANLDIGAIASADPLAAPFSILTDTCSNQTIAPSGSCTLAVRFAPTAAVTSNDSFDIPSNDPDEGTVTVSVSGTGSVISVPDITVTDSVAPNTDLQIPFGNVTVGSSSDETVTITNNGTANLTIGAIASANPLAGRFSIPTDNCSSQTIAPAGSCTLTVRFTPTTAGTSSSDNFDIPSNDPDEGTVTVSVSGTGLTAGPGISVSPTSLGFVACYIPEEVDTDSVTITSTGTANLNITSTVLGGSTSYSRVNNCLVSLPPAQSCTVTVTFAPTTGGVKNGTLTINSNAPARAVSLTGEALNCQL